MTLKMAVMQLLVDEVVAKYYAKKDLKIQDLK